jgi:hypothetical protein
MIKINSFSLSLGGLQLNYTSNNVTNVLSFDANATCNLFTELGIIDGFQNIPHGEPVILGEREHDYEDEQTGQIVWTTRPAFIFWCDYVALYPFTQRHAELLAEHHDSTKAHRKILHKINTLLTPAHSRQLVY